MQTQEPLLQPDPGANQGLPPEPASKVASWAHSPLDSLSDVSASLAPASSLQPALHTVATGGHIRGIMPLSNSGPFCDSLLLQANVYSS